MPASAAVIGSPSAAAPHELEPYTVLSVPGDPLSFDVRGSDEGGGWWYRVFIGDSRRLPRCECRYHEKKLRGTNIPCKHLAAALACPVCKGAGWFRPNGSVRFVNVQTRQVDLSPIPLACCVGEGTRAAWEREGCLVPREVTA